MKYGFCFSPIPTLRVQADERVENDRVGLELGLSQAGVNEFAELEIPGPDAGLEEKGVGGEVWVGTLLGHAIKGGDCVVELTHIEVVDQTVVKEFKVLVWG